jgi:hypothetical protein
LSETQPLLKTSRVHSIAVAATLNGMMTLQFDPCSPIPSVDKQPFHLIAEGVPIFERLPPRA